MGNPKGKAYYGTVLALVAGFALIGNRAQAGSDKFYSDLIRLDKVVTKINENYVEDVSSDELVDAAIEGIRGILDPHTAYFTPKQYEDLRTSTEGEFGGLGIQIGIRDNALTVVSPLQGTPAFRMGIQAGDRITKIDSSSTQNLGLEDAVEKLRGKPGTAVKLQIMREGLLEPLEFNIVREIIKIESVPLAAMLNDSVGYVKITQFAKRTGEDLEERVADLKKKGARCLVLDLRFNPGGLLNQAIAVAELFLDKGDMVVYTKGRVKSQNQEYHSRRGPAWTRKLVVLVNGSSASASEIVAGAMQDWDRGLILGETTYGKGSVQTILPLDGQQNTLKLTTAYYYTPAGRCINKPENAVRLKRKETGDGNGDSASARKDTTWFHTKAGRKVLANGGITPDVAVEAPRLNRFQALLASRNSIFDFVVKKRPELTKSGKVTPDFQVTPALVEEFRKFVYNDTAFTHFKSESALALEAFRGVLKKDKGDRASQDPGLEQGLRNLDAALKADAPKEFDRNLDYIRNGLKEELLSDVLGDSAKTVFDLKNDNQAQEALKYLADNRLYAKAIKKK